LSAKQEDEKPWFGKRCAKCNAPINYAYKGAINGWCGKCTDEVRQIFKDDLARELARESGQPAAPRGGGGKLVLGIVLGLLVGFGAAVATAGFASEPWGRLVGALAPAKKP
jgi:hypothetical protein